MPLDQFGRTINYLRISLTDMCNLRCVYCMPHDMTFSPTEGLLQDDEIIRLVPLFTGLGFKKIRLTGGEPTIRENIVELVRQIASFEEVEDLAMTTNGILLTHLAAPLAAAGLQRINVSIDTLNPEKFKQITRWGNVDDAWAGIHAAEDAGLAVKLNTVTVRGLNDGKDVVDIARLSIDHQWQIRYIEVMPLGSIAEYQKDHIVTEEELVSTIEAELGPLSLMNGGELDGEARIYQLEGAKGTLGFISSVTNPFCAGCNRARLTADGRLRLCLLRDKELDLLTLLRGGATNEELLKMIEDSIWFKPWGHGLAEQIFPHKRLMSEIGG